MSEAPSTPEPPLSVLLFVAGASMAGMSSVAALRRLAAESPTPLEVTVIDVLDEPALAEQWRVMATPTAIRTTPEPVARIVGDLGAPNAAEFVRDVLLPANVHKP